MLFIIIIHICINENFACPKLLLRHAAIAAAMIFVVKNNCSGITKLNFPPSTDVGRMEARRVFMMTSPFLNDGSNSYNYTSKLLVYFIFSQWAEFFIVFSIFSSNLIVYLLKHLTSIKLYFKFRNVSYY